MADVCGLRKTAGQRRPSTRAKVSGRRVSCLARVGSERRSGLRTRSLRATIRKESASTRSGPIPCGSREAGAVAGRTLTSRGSGLCRPGSPQTAAFIRARRDVRKPPGEEVADFEEYTMLYRDSWSDPEIRWLLSTVPTAMIFDDHDVNDDWNISESWVAEMRSLPWWEDRITGAFMAYWLYQHIGNLSPPELADERLLEAVQQDEDAGPRLRAAAHKWDRESAASRWAYFRDFGRSRLLVIDSRAARVLADGRREMIDEEEWDWIGDHARGSFDHLVVATTLPAFAQHGIHHLEAWSEAVCNGRWGSRAARIAERVRRAVDLEHWAAFERSFTRLVDLLRSASHGLGGEAPSTITILSGDVHTTYVAKIDLGAGAGPSRINQVVCSPFRNPLKPSERRVVRATGSRAAAAVFGLLARVSGVPALTASWSFAASPTYQNSIGELSLDERSATVTLFQSTHDAEGSLTCAYSTEIASGTD